MAKQPINPFVVRGTLDEASAQEVFDELRRHEPIPEVPAKTEAALQGAQGFVAFVAKCLQSLDLLTPEGLERAASPYQVEVEDESDVPALVRAMWNTKSLDHALVESPFNYLGTMATLIENLQVNPRKRRETFLSLGSGPGLYEVYLGAVIQSVYGPGRVTIKCTDVAPRMRTAFKKVLRAARPILYIDVKNVVYEVDDMTRLATVKDRSVDGVICNNALQWVPEWKKALVRIERVMDPAGLGWLHLFIHPHPMTAVTAEGRKMFTIGEIGHEELFDELEARRFRISRTRQFAGAKGTGQLGQATNRLYVLAQFAPDGVTSSWRDANVQAGVSFVR